MHTIENKRNRDATREKCDVCMQKDRLIVRANKPKTQASLYVPHLFLTFCIYSISISGQLYGQHITCKLQNCKKYRVKMMKKNSSIFNKKYLASIV